MIQKHQIVVLGGGLIGCAMALTLARHGLRVALVDRMAAEIRADPKFDGRAYAIAPGSANLLKALGLWDNLVDLAQPVQEISVADASPGLAAPGWIHFDPAETTAPSLGWIVEDRFLRRALLTALADAGVDQYAPADVVSTDAHPAGAFVRLDGQSDLDAQLIVACDGRRSTLARAAGIKYLAWSYGQTGLVSAISHDGPHNGVAHQSFFAGGPFAVLPLPGDRSAIVWSEQDAQANRIAALGDDAYLDEVRARVGDKLGKLELAGRRWSYPLGLAIAQNYTAPGMVVAGDAAHGVHPIAGQGLNMGLRDVAALTEVLVEARRRGEFIGSPSVTQRYEQWRRFDATAMALGMDGLNRLFSNNAPPIQAIRNLGMAAAAALGPARRTFMSVASGTAGDAPRLLTGQTI